VVVALGEIDGMPHPIPCPPPGGGLDPRAIHPGDLPQCESWEAALLRWVGILGSVVWLGDLLPPFGWHEGGCADHRVRVDRRDLIGAWHRLD
jgi:hypothetical protein